MRAWVLLAALLIPILAAGIGVGIYFLVKATKAKAAKARAAKAQAAAKAPAAAVAKRPTAPKKPPTQAPNKPPVPLRAYPPPRAAAPQIPVVPFFVPNTPTIPSVPNIKPAAAPKPPAPARTNCPRGRVPDPDNPSRLCKPSCRGSELGYAFWGPSGSCCSSIANTDCISWDQISKINDDKLAAEIEKKRQAAAEAERKRQEAIEAERKRQAAAAEKKRQAEAAAAEKKRQEAEKKRQAEAAAAEKKRQEAEKKRQAEAAAAERKRQEAIEAAERKRQEAVERQSQYSTGVAEMQRMLDGWKNDPEVGGNYNQIYNKSDNLTYFVSTKIQDQQGAVRRLSALQADAVKIQRYLADSPNDKAAGQRLVPYAPVSGASRIVGGSWTSGAAGWTMGEGTGVMSIMKVDPPAEAWPNEKRYYFLHELSHAAAPCAACPHNLTFYNQWRVIQKAAQVVFSDYRTYGTDAQEPPDDPARFSEWNPVNDRWWPRIQSLVNKYNSQKHGNFYP